MAEFKPQDELVERLYWLIRLRWIAAAGVILVSLSAGFIFKFSLPNFPLFLIAVLIAAYNLALLVFLSSHKSSLSFKIINALANVQISLDLVCLGSLIHFSGGIENPFIFYFIFHMIIASILLSRKASLWQASLAVSLFCLVILLEYFSILPHYCLKGFIINSLHNNALYLAGVSFVFVNTVYIAVYMASSISGRLKQREYALEKTNATLKEKDRLKSEYVLRVSHDIKEHLAAIQGCLEPVAGGITGELNSKQRDLIQRAAHRASKLMFFVKALLEITRIKLRNEIKMEYFSFKDVLSEAVYAIGSKAKLKDINVNCAIEPSIDRIRGAKEYIQETIINLLANSVKYTPNGGRIDITAADKGNFIGIAIKDTGIGISKEELPRIFEEFYRASNAKEVEKDGTGLGLSIAKQVIEKHHGKIWVESELGKGSSFRIELPK